MLNDGSAANLNFAARACSFIVLVILSTVDDIYRVEPARHCKAA